MKLSWAMGTSVAIHAGLLITHPPAGLVPPKETLTTLEVTYVALSSPKLKPAADAPQPTAPWRPARPLGPSALVESVQPPAAPARVVPQVPPVAAPSKQPDPSAPPAGVPSRPIVEERSKILPIVPASGASALPEKEFAVFQHKMSVRDHLKVRLVYPPIWSEGTVHVRLVLRPDGTLQDAVVLEATDPSLAAAALGGIRSAAPYPAFPKEMKESQARYDFLVQYRPD